MMTMLIVISQYAMVGYYPEQDDEPLQDTGGYSHLNRNQAGKKEEGVRKEKHSAISTGKSEYSQFPAPTGNNILLLRIIIPMAIIIQLHLHLMGRMGRRANQRQGEEVRIT